MACFKRHVCLVISVFPDMTACFKRHVLQVCWYKTITLHSPLILHQLWLFCFFFSNLLANLVMKGSERVVVFYLLCCGVCMFPSNGGDSLVVQDVFYLPVFICSPSRLFVGLRFINKIVWAGSFKKKKVDKLLYCLDLYLRFY